MVNFLNNCTLLIMGFGIGFSVSWLQINKNITGSYSKPVRYTSITYGEKTVRLIRPSDKDFDNIIDSVNSKLNN